ncbi:hypothetical protein SAMN02927900_03027 [Rhizobium mongolense subsp. loessense]|uniref:Uncharacterized protein n=1 Tax=Rhizobium mongolense subsp. loessense TaxID=158890 RepID=A0A1G4RV58_9HYPH|nr:hypothetical protein SAMN02927900_03027 [Rhizobium mongolense subsp. loessense]
MKSQDTPFVSSWSCKLISFSGTTMNGNYLFPQAVTSLVKLFEALLKDK